MMVDNFQDPEFTGSISDLQETGGTRGIGTVSGSVRGNRIQFVKRMPVRTFVFSDGTRMEEEEKPHRPIYYEGAMDPETGLVQGSWRFKMGIGFFKGTLAFYKATKGKWQMERQNDSKGESALR